MPDDDQGRGSKPKPLLELAAGFVGLLLTLGMFGFLGWHALTGPGHPPPAISIHPGPISGFNGGYVLEITARNSSPSTAAVVEVQGKLSRGGREVASSSTTFDYVPGHGTRQGGLFFDQDPRHGELELRALGYARP